MNSISNQLIHSTSNRIVDDLFLTYYHAVYSIPYKKIVIYLDTAFYDTIVVTTYNAVNTARKSVHHHTP